MTNKDKIATIQIMNINNVEYVDKRFTNLFSCVTRVMDDNVYVRYYDAGKDIEVAYTKKRFKEICRPSYPDEHERIRAGLKKPKIYIGDYGGVKVDAKEFFAQPEVQRKQRAMIELDITNKGKIKNKKLTKSEKDDMTIMLEGDINKVRNRMYRIIKKIKKKENDIRRLISRYDELHCVVTYNEDKTTMEFNLESLHDKHKETDDK